MSIITVISIVAWVWNQGHIGKIFKFAVGMTVAMGLLEYLLFGALKVVKSAYLQLKKEKEQDSDTQIIMNDQELV